MQEASNDIVKEALIRNVTADMNRAARDILTEQEEKDNQEKQFDSDLEDDLDLDDDPELRALERRRLEEMKKQHATKQANRIKGHGEYREIVEEEFLKEVCNSEHVVCHFYHTEFFACKVADKHLRILAVKHDDCKFIYLNAEKAPFFVTKLKIQMLPTMVIFKNGVAEDRLEGFGEISEDLEFSTETLERRLASGGAFKLAPQQQQSIFGFAHQGTLSDSDDDFDL